MIPVFGLTSTLRASLYLIIELKEESMDKALELRMAVDKHGHVEDALMYLNRSELIKRYENLENLTMLGEIFALIGLAEIPYSYELSFVKKLIGSINDNVATDQGFSYTGKMEDIVPCYNAMIFEAYSRLGLGKTKQAQNALSWIKSYQVFDRNRKTAWKYDGICKYGGCMKSVPCYIGIGKTVKALITYRDIVDSEDTTINQLINNGLDYMLKHQMFKRLSIDKPISANITKNMFPQNYILSITDLLYIASKGNLLKEGNTVALIEKIEQKRTKTGGWKIEHIYKYNGYIPFDNRRQDSQWLTYIYNSLLNTTF